MTFRDPFDFLAWLLLSALEIERERLELFGLWCDVQSRGLAALYSEEQLQ